jgi:hypothetical protein
VNPHRDPFARRHGAPRAASNDVRVAQRAIAPLDVAILSQRFGQNPLVRWVLGRAKKNNVAFCSFAGQLFMSISLPDADMLTLEGFGACGMEAQGRLDSG